MPVVVEGVAPAVVEGVAPVAPLRDQGFPSTEARKQTADCGLTVTPPSASGGPRPSAAVVLGKGRGSIHFLQYSIDEGDYACSEGAPHSI
jgi:hypothetical protein